MYIAPGQGQTTSWGQMLMSTESPYHFAHLLQVLNNLYTFWHVFPDVYSSGGGWQTPGVKILMSTERPYHFDHLLQVLKKSPWTLIFIHTFYVFSRVYSPGPGADNALGSTFWSQQKGFITLTISCKFKKQFFQLWFYTYFLKSFYTCI